MVGVDDQARERVTKLDAARRQLREAVRMFFEERDGLAAHTVTAAAHQLLHDMLAKAGQDGSFLRGGRMIRPRCRTEFKTLVSKSENFLKHADRDPEEVLEFRPSLTKYFLLDAAEMY